MIHLITTIELGGAEKSLVRLATKQVSAGKSVKVIFLKGKSELLSELSEGGVQVLNQFSNRSFALQLVLLRKFLREVNRSETVFHAHLPRAEIITYLALLGDRQYRYVATRHNAEPFWPGGNRFLSSILSRMLHRRSELVAISKAVKEFMKVSKEVIPEKEVAVVYYSSNITPRKKYSVKNSSHSATTVTSEKIHIGTIARLEPQKQVEMLIKTFHLLQQDHKDWTLHILGDGSQRNNLMTLVAKLGLSEKVSFFTRTKRIDEFLNSLDFFVLCSSYEGFGLVLLEAMHATIPIVASDTTAVPEVLGFSHPGLVYPINPDRFAKTISKFASSKDLRKSALSIQEKRLNFFVKYPEVESYNKVYSKLNKLTV